MSLDYSTRNYFSYILIPFLITLAISHYQLIYADTILKKARFRKAPITYKEIMNIAIHKCKNVRPSKVNKKLVQDIIKIEQKHNVPKSMTGMLLASACMESGYNPKAEGDRKFSKKRKPKAIGLFQMWPWWESKRWGYGIDRRDPIQSANAYILHIKSQLTKIRCKFRSKKRRWIVAWVTAIRAPKRGGRCHEKPKHYKLLKKWHRNIIKQRQNHTLLKKKT